MKSTYHLSFHSLFADSHKSQAIQSTHTKNHSNIMFASHRPLFVGDCSIYSICFYFSVADGLPSQYNAIKTNNVCFVEQMFCNQSFQSHIRWNSRSNWLNHLIFINFIPTNLAICECVSVHMNKFYVDYVIEIRILCHNFQCECISPLCEISHMYVKGTNFERRWYIRQNVK